MISDKYIPGIGPIGAKLLILGEAPSYEEIESGKPFVGPAGRELDRLLKDAGINRSDCWLTNVCKYQVSPSPRTRAIPFATRALNDGINLQQQLYDLQTEINSISPNCILGLGGTALWALTGKTKISNYRGSIMSGMGYKCVNTYHPAHLIHQAGGEIKGYWNRQVMIFDMRRALNQSRFKEIILPKRNLHIIKNSYEFQHFIDRNKNSAKPAIDIEAGGSCLPICIGISFNPSEGITVPLWNQDGISNIPTTDLVQIWILLAEFLSKHDIVGQNFKYDQDKIARLGFSIRSLASDVMLKTFAINPELPKRLAFNQSIYTEEPFYKDEGMYEGSYEDLFIGCARDACVTKEIDLNTESDLDELGLRNYYQNFLLPLHSMYLDMESEGFNDDPEQRDKLLHKYISWKENLKYDLWKLVDAEVNWNSPKQVAVLLFEALKLPKRAGTGEEELTTLLNNAKIKDEHKRIISIILTGRRIDKTISTYMMAPVDFDGKMRTTFFLCNETGRTSTGQQDPPIRPYVNTKTGEITNKKGNKPEIKALGMAFQTITKHGDIGEDIRSRFVPDKGHVFIQADSSQAEARVVFLLANDEEALAALDTHDYHALTASWFFGRDEAAYSKKILGYEHPIRFVGKTLRHACHLGASAKRAAITVNTDARRFKIDMVISEVFADTAIGIFHAKQPSIRQVFHKGIQECLMNNKRRLVAPVPYGIDSPIGGIRIFYERWGDELFRQAYSYIPQRTVTDNTKAAGLRLRKAIKGIRIILESHDSLLFCVPENRVDDFAPIIKEEFERPIRFDNCSMPRRDLVIPCELEVGYNYQELKKYRFRKEYSLPI